MKSGFVWMIRHEVYNNNVHESMTNNEQEPLDQANNTYNFMWTSKIVARDNLELKDCCWLISQYVTMLDVLCSTWYSTSSHQLSAVADRVSKLRSIGKWQYSDRRPNSHHQAHAPENSLNPQSWLSTAELERRPIASARNSFTIIIHGLWQQHQFSTTSPSIKHDHHQCSWATMASNKTHIDLLYHWQSRPDRLLSSFHNLTP